MKKERLDKHLTDLGYFETKSKAAAAILAGTVKVNDEVITKAGYQIDVTKEYDFSVKTMPYVSRGGFKLQKALDAFNFSPEGRIAFNASASDILPQWGEQEGERSSRRNGKLPWRNVTNWQLSNCKQL